MQDLAWGPLECASSGAVFGPEFLLFGINLLFSHSGIRGLPGDRMFQATGIMDGRQRPAIMHAYGGAKAGMERSLATIAAEGWIPMAAAMLGTAGKPPMWASVGLRPVAGTTIDFKVLPPSLSERETTYTLVLATVGRRWGPGLCPVPMACWN